MSLETGATFAGYTVRRLLGSGGMGDVYLVQHPRLPRLDAMKVLGLMLSNGAVALSGGLTAQYQGFADVNMGRGAIVIGLVAGGLGGAVAEVVTRVHPTRVTALGFPDTFAPTGSAGWLWRVVLEDLLGPRLENGEISFAPRLPSGWTSVSVTLRGKTGKNRAFTLRSDGSWSEQSGPRS